MRDGNIILSGKFEVELDLNGDELKTQNPLGSSFVCSLDADFNFNWGNSFESTDGTEIVDLKIGSFGCPYVLLNYIGNSINGSGLDSYTSLGGSDLLVFKLDNDSGNVIWQKPIASTSDDIGMKIVTDEFGMLLVGVNLQPVFFRRKDYESWKTALFKLNRLLG